MQGIGFQDSGAEQNPPLFAVRHNVNRVDTGPPLKVTGDLMHAVGGGIENDDLFASLNVVDQNLIVRHGTVDEDDFDPGLPAR
ncbi:hypothetical protein TSA6c_00650 [Azospirillum sp. TSA6c]|nr:hypothetical protein TSA6c_00650 [Azospirillum sp. TSA6c]